MAGTMSIRIFEDTGTARESQIYAAVVLPFFIVFAIVVAGIVNTILLDLIPDTVAALNALRFLLGTLLVIATGAAAILWVRTGGFGLFA